MSAPILDLRGAGFGYVSNARVLSNISFAIHPGEVVALVGRNGAGKSTMLRLLNGLLRPQEGQVLVQGADSAGMKVAEISRHIGTVFQAPEQQIFNASVESEIAFGPARMGLTPEEERARISDAADRCGLTEVMATHPLDLDAARRRFVALASVLACTPALILLDEAQRGLDRENRDRLGRIIRDESAQGRAVLLVCHDMDFVAAHAARVLALAEGHLIADLPVADFFADAAATRRASVEQPGIVELSLASLGEVALNARAYADRAAERLRKGKP
ncbi:energy-coupling factor ABC transporter ATP-binding protein [Paracoccus sp. IB05]|uniref:energy-coupling factor ABC transporter ATP-binding protein n=1 Tax=Paracoccus sp. IB05 TaxID=2779367 RepID=UPI0018E865AA|nr:ABC transporter ATP-binding protein [Paracoccus sp. IB05]MBJ2150206.1 ABC transporter ATP-binding protein [Paracoccus sp. IB05]